MRKVYFLLVNTSFHLYVVHILNIAMEMNQSSYSMRFCKDQLDRMDASYEKLHYTKSIYQHVIKPTFENDFDFSHSIKGDSGVFHITKLNNELIIKQSIGSHEYLWNVSNILCNTRIDYSYLSLNAPLVLSISTNNSIILLPLKTEKTSSLTFCFICLPFSLNNSLEPYILRELSKSRSNPIFKFTINDIITPHHQNGDEDFSSNIQIVNLMRDIIGIARNFSPYDTQIDLFYIYSRSQHAQHQTTTTDFIFPIATIKYPFGNSFSVPLRARSLFLAIIDPLPLTLRLAVLTDTLPSLIRPNVAPPVSPFDLPAGFLHSFHALLPITNSLLMLIGALATGSGIYCPPDCIVEGHTTRHAHAAACRPSPSSSSSLSESAQAVRPPPPKRMMLHDAANINFSGGTETPLSGEEIQLSPQTANFETNNSSFARVLNKFKELNPRSYLPSTSTALPPHVDKNAVQPEANFQVIKIHQKSIMNSITAISDLFAEGERQQEEFPSPVQKRRGLMQQVATDARMGQVNSSQRAVTVKTLILSPSSQEFRLDCLIPLKALLKDIKKSIILASPSQSSFPVASLIHFLWRHDTEFVKKSLILPLDKFLSNLEQTEFAHRQNNKTLAEDTIHHQSVRRPITSSLHPNSLISLLSDRSLTLPSPSPYPSPVHETVTSCAPPENIFLSQILSLLSLPQSPPVWTLQSASPPLAPELIPEAKLNATVRIAAYYAGLAPLAALCPPSLTPSPLCLPPRPLLVALFTDDPTTTVTVDPSSRSDMDWQLAASLAGFALATSQSLSHRAITLSSLRMYAKILTPSEFDGFVSGLALMGNLSLLSWNELEMLLVNRSSSTSTCITSFRILGLSCCFRSSRHSGLIRIIHNIKKNRENHNFNHNPNHTFNSRAIDCHFSISLGMLYCGSSDSAAIDYMMAQWLCPESPSIIGLNPIITSNTVLNQHPMNKTLDVLPLSAARHFPPIAAAIAVGLVLANLNDKNENENINENKKKSTSIFNESLKRRIVTTLLFGGIIPEQDSNNSSTTSSNFETGDVFPCFLRSSSKNNINTSHILINTTHTTPPNSFEASTLFKLEGREPLTKLANVESMSVDRRVPSTESSLPSPVIRPSVRRSITVSCSLGCILTIGLAAMDTKWSDVASHMMNWVSSPAQACSTPALHALLRSWAASMTAASPQIPYWLICLPSQPEWKNVMLAYNRYSSCYTEQNAPPLQQDAIWDLVVGLPIQQLSDVRVAGLVGILWADSLRNRGSGNVLLLSVLSAVWIYLQNQKVTSTSFTSLCSRVVPNRHMNMQQKGQRHIKNNSDASLSLPAVSLQLLDVVIPLLAGCLALVRGGHQSKAEEKSVVETLIQQVQPDLDETLSAADCPSLGELSLNLFSAAMIARGVGKQGSNGFVAALAVGAFLPIKHWPGEIRLLCMKLLDMESHATTNECNK